jgi:hypothetical protein
MYIKLYNIITYYILYTIIIHYIYIYTLHVYMTQPTFLRVEKFRHFFLPYLISNENSKISNMTPIVIAVSKMSSFQ